jgi:hypothetical protein
MLALCFAGAQKREAGMPELQDTGADDILELLEIAQALARAETAAYFGHHQNHCGTEGPAYTGSRTRRQTCDTQH